MKDNTFCAINNITVMLGMVGLYWLSESLWVCALVILFIKPTKG